MARIGREDLIILRKAGLLDIQSPLGIVGFALQAMRWRISPATGYAGLSISRPRDVGIIDDDGDWTFAEIHALAEGLARGLAQRGVSCGMRVGVLLQNSRWLPIALSALAQLGADAILLNTGFSETQLRDACRTEGADFVLRDRGLSPVLCEPGKAEVPVSDVVMNDGRPVAKPRMPGRVVILTSGTRGRPKGAARSSAGLSDAVSLLGSIPLHARETTVLAAPAFHAWGFAQMSLAAALGSTLVMRRGFDPKQVVSDVEEYGATAVVVVPVMIQRILDLGEDFLGAHDLSTLRVVATSGSAIPIPVAMRFMDLLGDVIYNLYGSTEAAFATVASPEDLRSAPGTAGRPLRGVTVRVLNDDGLARADGGVGRIFVGSSQSFSGYTDGADKARVDGLVATGDVGRFDADGRLMIEGRDDDMIISGGENVFPREVEDVIAEFPDVAECAVIGVPDEDFGARLAAFVVASEGSTIDSDAVRAHVRDRLARFKVPRDVIVLDSLPRNATGKILKKELGAKLGL